MKVSEKSAVCTGERTAAKDNGADGANGLVIGDADVAAWRFFLDGHFGNDGNAHAGTDHAEKTAKLAAFKNDLRMEARAVAGRNGADRGGLRISPHFYNTPAEIDRLVGALAGYARTGV